MMSDTGKAVIGVTALGLVASGALLWAQFGSLVYFDLLASAFAGCFL